MKRKGITILSCSLLIWVGSILPAYAEVQPKEISIFQPMVQGYGFRADQSTSLSVGLDIRGGTATVSSVARGQKNKTTSMSISADLQKKTFFGWETVKTFSTSSQTYQARLSETTTVSKGNTYRVKAVSTAKGGGKTETTTTYSSSVKY